MVTRINRTVPLLIATLAAGALASPIAAPLQAQSLRGSPASVDRMYYRAHSNRLPFYSDADEVKAAASEGKLTVLWGNMDYAVVGTALPYVRPATVRFIEALGAAHRQACGEPIVVTSGVRPTSRKLRNGHVKSVHPTGMAVDIRKSPGTCRDWLRRALIGLEAQGMIEAIEENRPPHFHIAVFKAPEPAAVLSAAARAETRTAARASSARGRARAASTAKTRRAAEATTASRGSGTADGVGRGTGDGTGKR